MGIKCPKCQHDNPDDTLYCGKCAAPLKHPEDISVTKTLETPVEELAPGSAFAKRYKIIEELGKGGMGRVYKVHDAEINESVALKLLKPEIASDENTIERFRNELKIARKVSHKNVCRMYDIGREDEKYFITMEYVAGEDLKSLIRKKGHMSTEEAIGIAQQVCEGLAEAHRLGVVHRDLKPQNIMIDHEGQAKIMDFGIARSVEAPGVTQTGVIIGTPDYISPEQAEGETADQRSDIYSLGVILYEMVTGSVPFKGDTAFSVALKHKTQLPQDPRKLNSQLSDDLARLILVCMEKDRERRYQTAGDLLADLRNIEEGFPLGTKIKPRKETFPATMVRNRLFIPALIVVVAIVAVLIWKLLPRGQIITTPLPEDKPALAILRFTNNTGDEGLDFWRSALCELLIQDLSQSKYVYVLPSQRLLDILSKFDLENSENYSYDDLQKLASWSGFNQIVTGEYYRSGEIFRINFTLHDAGKGEAIGKDTAEGEGQESLFGMVDELTRKIKKLVKLPEDKIATDFDLSIGEITTSYPEAYKFFSEGTLLYYKTDYLGAIPLLENAVALDPGLAMAYRHLAAIHRNLGKISELRKYSQKAFELADRVSERERLIIQGGYYYNRYEDDKALEVSKKLVQLYPDDILGNRLMGVIYEDGYGDIETAAKYYEMAYRNYPENGVDCCNLASAYWYQGLVDEAGEILEKYLENFPDSPSVKRFFIENLINQKKYDLALEELEGLFRLAPTRYPYPQFRGDIYLFKGQPLQAEQEYKKGLEAEGQRDQFVGLWRYSRLYLAQGKFDNSKKMLEKAGETSRLQGQKYFESWAHIDLAYLQLRTGNFREAINECEKAEMIAKETELDEIYLRREALYPKAKAYLGLKSMAEAEKVAEELKISLEKEKNKREFGAYHRIKGLIELEKGNFNLAAKNFERAISLSRPFTYQFPNDYINNLDPLARAHYRAGNLELARMNYEKIISHPRVRRDYGDIYARSFYMLGRIFEQQGDTAKAIENYEKFLTLWKDADPIQPEIEDTKARLALLKST